jgi:hypothetical protein
LKVGDRIWSITNDINHLISDEIVLMMHNGPNKPGFCFYYESKVLFNILSHSGIFYTFRTSEGDEVSLTASHNLPVFDLDENKIIFLRASKVTMKHRLVMYGRTIKIENITINQRIGFYSPLTLSGYLFVNNISTSVFSDT